MPPASIDMNPFDCLPNTRRLYWLYDNKTVVIASQMRLFIPLNGSSALLDVEATSNPRGGNTAFIGSIATERLAGCIPAAAAAKEGA